MYRVLVIACVVATALAKDLIAGHDGGRLFYEQNATASPAIWRQVNNVTVNASDFEVITQVVVIDRREDKNGEATIVDGGEGYRNVTIELKSPAVFRGYDFTIKVFAKPEDDVQKPGQERVPGSFGQEIVDGKQVTKKDEKEPKGLLTPVPTRPTITSTTSTTESAKGQEVRHPILIGQDNVQQPIATNQEVHHPGLTDQDKIQIPVLTGQDDKQQVRPNRDTYEEHTEEPLSSTTIDDEDQTTEDSQQSDEEQDKEFDHMADDEAWKAVIDEIFAVKQTPEIKPAYIPLGTKSQDTGDHEHSGDLPVEEVPVSTEKSFTSDDESTVPSQKDDSEPTVLPLKPVSAVPLPYQKQ